MLKTVLIDDEESSRTTMSWLLKRHCPDVSVIGEAEDVAEAVELLEATEPDLVFLDIELNTGTGFDVLEHLTRKPANVVFATAFNEFAIKAFHYSALHYLLKPIDPKELVESVERAKEQLAASKQESDADRIQLLLDNLRAPNQQLTRLMVPVLNGFRMVSVDDIYRLESDGNYTYFHLRNAPKLLVSRTMKDFETILDDRFFRIHRTHLINLDYVTGYVKGRGGMIELQDGSQLAVSRYRKDELLKVLEVRG